MIKIPDYQQPVAQAQPRYMDFCLATYPHILYLKNSINQAIEKVYTIALEGFIKGRLKGLRPFIR